MGKRLTPVEVCEWLIGPPPVIGPIAGLGPKAAYLWRHENGEREKGDLPSARVMRALLAHSRAQGLGLTAEHLLYGAPGAEIAAILSARELPAGMPAGAGSQQPMVDTDPQTAAEDGTSAADHPARAA